MDENKTEKKTIMQKVKEHKRAIGVTAGVLLLIGGGVTAYVLLHHKAVPVEAVKQIAETAVETAVEAAV